jgi:hypothetical protein
VGGPAVSDEVGQHRYSLVLLVGRTGVAPTWLRFVRTSAGAGDGFEGVAEIVG